MKTFSMTMMVTLLAVATPAFAARPSVYTELLDYVIPAPDQGTSASCLYVGSTGAMEMLLNQKHGLKHQRPGARFDLSERFLIWQDEWEKPGHRVEAAARKFNWGEAIHINELPFRAYNDDGSSNDEEIWAYPEGFPDMPRLDVPAIETKRIFVRGEKWDTYVIKPGDVEAIKQALWKHRAPVLINYNDNRFWHVITIIGYDDTIQNTSCYDLEDDECSETQEGTFYVRDSFGVPTELRDTDWFRVKGNAAFVVKLAE